MPRENLEGHAARAGNARCNNGATRTSGADDAGECPGVSHAGCAGGAASNGGAVGDGANGMMADDASGADELGTVAAEGADDVANCAAVGGWWKWRRCPHRWLPMCCVSWWWHG